MHQAAMAGVAVRGSFAHRVRDPLGVGDRVCMRAHVRRHMLASVGLQGPLPVLAALLTVHASRCLQGVQREGHLVGVWLNIVQIAPSGMQPALT
jgi:hypothetical protein